MIVPKVFIPKDFLLQKFQAAIQPFGKNDFSEEQSFRETTILNKKKRLKEWPFGNVTIQNTNLLDSKPFGTVTFLNIDLHPIKMYSDLVHSSWLHLEWFIFSLSSHVGSKWVINWLKTYIHVNKMQNTFHDICISYKSGLLYFPGNMFISRTYWEILGNTGKYKILNNGLLVGPVVGVLTCWKLIILGTKTHYRSK